MCEYAEHQGGSDEGRQPSSDILFGNKGQGGGDTDGEKEEVMSVSVIRTHCFKRCGSESIGKACQHECCGWNISSGIR